MDTYGRACQRLLTLLAGLLLMSSGTALAWEPSKPVEFVVTGGLGGGADQMARVLQGIIAKHGLMSQPLVVVVKGGGGGAEGMLEVKASSGDPHKLMIGLSNIYMVPLATKIPFRWTDVTPVALMALDQFVLWVHADTPYKTAEDLRKAIQAAPPRSFKVGGGGSKREDHLLTAAIEQAWGVQLLYIPFKGGGLVASQLVGKHIDANVNNPLENISQWRAGQIRPLCVFDDQPMPYTEKVTRDQSWGDIPPCRESGLDVRFLMLRGIFMPPNVTREQVAYYTEVLRKVRETPDWRDFVKRGAFKDVFLTGEEFKRFLRSDEAFHVTLMKQAKFID